MQYILINYIEKCNDYQFLPTDMIFLSLVMFHQHQYYSYLCFLMQGCTGNLKLFHYDLLFYVKKTIFYHHHYPDPCSQGANLIYADVIQFTLYKGTLNKVILKPWQYLLNASIFRLGSKLNWWNNYDRIESLCIERLGYLHGL